MNARRFTHGIMMHLPRACFAFCVLAPGLAQAQIGFYAVVPILHDKPYTLECLHRNTSVARSANLNPNRDLIAECGSISWHNGMATLTAAGPNPLRQAAEMLGQGVGLAATGGIQNYSPACQVRSPRFCFIEVSRVPATPAPAKPVCSIPGYNPGK